jgi:hypothetical protein
LAGAWNSLTLESILTLYPILLDKTASKPKKSADLFGKLPAM